MRKLIILFLVFIFTLTKAQDQLFKKDNTKIEVKILEINPTQIKYKLFSNPDGPLYVINKNEVALIIYKNGQHEAFKEAPPENTDNSTTNYETIRAQQREAELKKFKELTKKNNIVFGSVAEMFNFAVGGAYFREILSNNIDVHVPFAVSFGEPFAYNSGGIFGNKYFGMENIYNFKAIRKAFDLGLGIYFNTYPNKAITHFIGPMFRMAQFNATFQTDFYKEPENYDPNQQYYYGAPQFYINRGCVYNETYFSLNNGILFRIKPEFNVMVNANIGRMAKRTYVANNPSQYSPYNYNYLNFGGKTFIQLGFNIGYRF